MAKKDVQITRDMQNVILNPNESPTLYSNQCEVTRLSGDTRITFREIIEIQGNEIRMRELVRVYINATVGRQLANILKEALAEKETTETS